MLLSQLLKSCNFVLSALYISKRHSDEILKQSITIRLNSWKLKPNLQALFLLLQDLIAFITQKKHSLALANPQLFTTVLAIQAAVVNHVHCIIHTSLNLPEKTSRIACNKMDKKRCSKFTFHSFVWQPETIRLTVYC